LHFLCVAFVPALPRDIELRNGVGDGDGVQGSQDNDRQVDQHLLFSMGYMMSFGLPRQLASIHGLRRNER
jgi:hypothetical protein